MNLFQIPCVVRAVLAAAAIMLFQFPGTALAENNMVTGKTLLDRIRIEDLMTRYYVDLTSASGQEMADHFTEDGVLDINGMTWEGRGEIKQLYAEMAERRTDDKSRFHMLMTNPIINIDGNTATIWLIWTGVMNDNIRMAPRFDEQGREFSKLVKHNGRWLIKHRSVTADSGLPDRWDDEYQPRTYR